MQEKVQEPDLKDSIVAAFNLGVWMRHKKGGGDNISDIAKELRDMIFWNMSKPYGGTLPDELLNANVEYFQHIALLGYILPGISLPDEELKNRLLSVIEGRAMREASQQSAEQYSSQAVFNY